VAVVVVEVVDLVPYASRCLCKYNNDLITDSDNELILKSRDMKTHLNGNFTSSSQLTK
jgi:hypothetical protein